MKTKKPSTTGLPMRNYWILAALAGILYPIVHIISKTTIGAATTSIAFGNYVAHTLVTNLTYVDTVLSHTASLFICLPLLIVIWGFRAKKLPDDLNLKAIYKQYLLPSVIMVIPFQFIAGVHGITTWYTPFMLLSYASILCIVTPKGIRSMLLITATIFVIKVILGYVLINISSDATLSIQHSILAGAHRIPEYLLFVALFQHYVGKYYKAEISTEDYWSTIKASLNMKTKIISVNNK